MDLPHTGFLKRSVELLRIETNIFTLYIEGKPFHPTVEMLQLHRPKGEWTEAYLKCSSAYDVLQIERVQVFSPHDEGLIDWNEGDISFPCFYETQDYELVIVKKQVSNIRFYHENVLLRQAIKPKGDSVLTGILSFGNEVGFTELEVQIDNQSALTLEVEIFPSKMDYKRDYQMLLKEINEQIYNLSFDFLRRTYQMSGLRETQHQSLTEFFTILQHIFSQMHGAMERIQVNPHQKLTKENQLREVSRVKRAGKENLAYLAKHPQYLARDDINGIIRLGNQSYQPTHLLETRRRISYDTQENRFLKWMLERVIQKLKQLKVRWNGRNRVPDPLLIKRIDMMIRQIDLLLRVDFLQQVGPMKQMNVSLVLQMAPGYRDIYRYYLMLLKGLSIQSDLLRLSMKDVAQIYEYWCFLKLHHLLSKKYKLIKQDIIKVNRSGIFVTLDKGRKSKMVYENPLNGETFTLYYNALPESDKTPTLSQKPDNILSLKKKDAGQEKEYKFIFDAKYRMNAAYPGTPYHNVYGSPGPEEDDINTMHRYRDAIVYSSNSSAEYERSMFGAYVLFPYPDEERFKEHHFYKSIKKLNIGALPFLPNSTRLVEDFLDELIQDSPEKAYERSTKPKGTKEYFVNKLSGKNVLVGSLREVSQMHTALEHKFYHLPLENVTDIKVLTQLTYIAMCQSRKKFETTGKTGIHYVGKIIDWKVVRRREIKERPVRPGTEERLYVKFTIENWEELEQPIALGGQRIYTVLYTSKYIFDRAQEIAELKLESEEELRQWREKRRLGKVKVTLNHSYVDLADKVLDVEVE
ncbi:restriction endonuclease-like protein [Paenibacillus sp. FSL K6-2524]|uniref:restriction endonuclease-like protein n=1 Tax=Paenibacillus sp. FSL K6-2524 TaxID=2954516 RepID=UPI0030FAEC46